MTVAEADGSASRPERAHFIAMTPFWIDTENTLRLAIAPRPRGGDWLEDDLRRLKNLGVDVLVSMLPQQEAIELGLAEEQQLSQQTGITFRSFPIRDRETPASLTDFSSFIKELQQELQAGLSIAVHCRASIGRSSLLLAALLTAEGFDAADAFERLTRARGLQVPDTPEQVQWVELFSHALKT